MQAVPVYGGQPAALPGAFTVQQPAQQAMLMVPAPVVPQFPDTLSALAAVPGVFIKQRMNILEGKVFLAVSFFLEGTCRFSKRLTC